RDYLGAYNSAVTFTPSFDAFAHENVAFRRAFTRYGATGLAVPSLWTGGMLLHKQYTMPFPPMNTLAKLLAEQEYTQWIGMDHIMETILPPSADRHRLDADLTVKDYRFCRTIGEVRARLAERLTGDRPVFVYSLPQDLHVSTIARDGGSAIDSDGYPGFYAPVASRLKAIDRCFGDFIGDLKARGLYDESIVIVTSDHGDSLGEEGRMGHAYTLYPEVVRIPLLMHLPSRLASTMVPENEGLVFSTDITPTLHALLGASPAQPRPFFGRSLFRAGDARPRGPESAVPVLAASYGAVYAALLDEGDTLYVLDTINLREQAFSLSLAGTRSAVTATPAIREAGQQAIRTTVEDIAAFYKFDPPRANHADRH
ncbi:MAG: sulfatase-like hydrolase/transferase, partial [Gemmatimonadetes bacterium]|nr:sulfatase-like hydrolase/transferase [Gemmatimonadota bacterium]